MSYRSPLLAALCAFSAVACEAPPEPTATPPSLHRDPVSVQRGKPARPAIAVAPRLVPQQVTWPARDTVDAEVRSRLDTTQLRAVDASGVPVLAPRDASVYAQVHVVSQPAWFTVSLKDDAYAAELLAQRGSGSAPAPGGAVTHPLPADGGLAVFVQGNRLAHDHPHIPPVTGKQRVRGLPGWITQNESIWSATWTENGVSYVVEVECSRPDDARCADEEVLMDVVDSLVFVGGVGGVR